MNEMLEGVPPGYLTSEQAAEKLSVPYRSLMHWVENGLVSPFTAGPRRRAPRLWAEKHLREARVIRKLRDEGVSMHAVRKAMDVLRELGHNPFSTGRFLALSRGAEVVKVCDSGEAISCLKVPGQTILFFVDLEQAAEE